MRKWRIPSYLRKDGHFVLVFQTQSFKIIENGKVARLSMGKWFTKERDIRYLCFDIPPHVQGKPIKEIRVLPRWDARYFEIEYVYEKELEEHDLDENKYLGIDLGLDNLATCVDTDANAFIMDGKAIKSFNQWWNKKKARLQSVHDKQGIRGSKAMANLSKKRSNKMRNFMAQTVNYIVTHCIENGIGNIVIGKLKNIKQNATLGKRTNQNFQSIPLGFFKQKLKSKCELHGIAYQEVNEAYTSQTCSICGKLKKSNRIHRGAYRCYPCNQFINADVNGAVNILKKVVPESVTIGNSGVVNIPIRIRLVV